MTGFIFLGFKITADSDNSHEIKRHFLLGRKAMTDFTFGAPKSLQMLTAAMKLKDTSSFEEKNDKLE